MYKTKLVHCCDVVPNLVVEIEIFNFHNQIWNDVTAMKRLCFIHFVVKSFLFCRT